LWKQKIYLNFTAQKANIWPPASSPAAFARLSIRPGPQVGDRKINLPLELIYPGDMHAQLIAHREPAAALPSDKTALAGREHIESSARVETWIKPVSKISGSSTKMP
jgi:hypothetical protein